jgi:uncharacterized protein (TIGR00299 family) protein
MRIGYLDAHAGISGDMLLGAMLQAGLKADVLHQALAALHLGAALQIEEVDRCGIHALKATILVDGHPAEEASAQAHSTLPHAHDHHHDEEKHEPHTHSTRGLSSILDLISAAKLPGPVKDMAARTFQLLGESEARIHHVPVEAVHFHEVGAVDAIADIVLAAAGAHALGVERWHGSKLNVGGGTVVCAHGRFPVPAPATADLLRGTPTYSSGEEMEMVTPTGAALVRAFGCEFGPTPTMRVDSIGYGAGTRNPPAFANVLRLSLGETESQAATSTVTVLETALDDLNPQIIAHVAETALQLGALDVMCTPVLMKKGRPGTLLTILADAAQVGSLQNLLLRETSTLGVRRREETRVCLQRSHVAVETPWGAVRLKRGTQGEEELKAAPEFEDCRRIAQKHGVPLRLVMETALHLYRGSRP